MTVIARRFAASPVRVAGETWTAIAALVCGEDGSARMQFAEAAGVASSLIADEVLRDSPLVVAGTGARLRVYCLYDEDAIEGDDANESALNWNPTEGDWKVHLPCRKEDMPWASAALAAKSADNFVLYDPSLGLQEEPEKQRETSLTIDVKGFREL